MRMSRRSLLAYDRLVGDSGDRAAAAYGRMLSLWLSENPHATENEVVDAAADFACAALDTFGASAAAAADELCRQLAAQDGVSGTTHTDYAPDRGEVGRVLGGRRSRAPLARGDRPGFVAASSDRVRDECHRAANGQMLRSAKALGCSRYARVPVGDSKTCGFCVSVAANGFHGLTEEGAKRLLELHDNCRCKVVPGFGRDPSVEGYDPGEYEEANELRKRLEQEGYSVSQIQRAMAGEPVGSLGPPNSGVGGRPKRQVATTELPRVRDEYVVSYPSGMGKYGDPIKPHVYDRGNFRDHKHEWRDVFAHDMLSLGGFDVVALSDSAPEGFKNIDVTLDGVLWEIKSLEDKAGGQKCKPGNEFKCVSNALDAAYRQFHGQYDPVTKGKLRWTGPINVVVNNRYKSLDDDGVLQRIIEDLEKKKDKFEVIFIAKDGSLTLVNN